MSRQKERLDGNMLLKVEEVMVRQIVTVNEDYPIKDAARVMNKFEIGSLIVVSEGKAVGIITERDVLKRVVAESKNTKKTKVKDVMTSPLVVVGPEIELEEAVKLIFQMKIKKLPVIEGERIVGLLSLTDVARFHPQIMKMLKQFVKNQVVHKRMQKLMDYNVV